MPTATSWRSSTPTTRSCPAGSTRRSRLPAAARRGRGRRAVPRRRPTAPGCSGLRLPARHAARPARRRLARQRQPGRRGATRSRPSAASTRRSRPARTSISATGCARSGLRIVSDARLENIHHGDPRTLREVFFGELWRGRDNLRVSFRAAVAWAVAAERGHSVCHIVLMAIAASVWRSALVGRFWPARGRGRDRGVSSRPARLRVIARGRARARRLELGRHAAGVRRRVRLRLRRALALVSRAPHRSVRPQQRDGGVMTTGRFGSSSCAACAAPAAGRRRRSCSAPRAPIRSRFAVTVCYLRDERDEVFGIDAKAADLPVDYVEVLEAHSFDPAIWPRLRRLVRERAIDIVHAHDYKTDLLAWLLATIRGRSSRCRPSTAGPATAARALALLPARQARAARGSRELIAVSSDIRRRAGSTTARARRVSRGPERHRSPARSAAIARASRRSGARSASTTPMSSSARSAGSSRRSGSTC